MMDDARKQLVDNIRIAITRKRSENTILKTAVELIDAFSDDHNWTGFYMRKGRILEVGPYLGPATPHLRIELNQGICGAAASEGKSIIVDDVNADPRFLACSLSTRSEIVVPLMDGDRCLGEIDIDSNKPAHFTTQDREMLEAVADVIVRRLREIR
jgi:putative methionine-R-sulfoxide reductase with GAF domain